MDRTAELRWFFRRPPPQPVLDWFAKVADPPEARSDVYLVLPETDALGVKVRGGTRAFELKVRPRPPQLLDLACGVSGQLEEWQRWSFSRPAISRLLPRFGLPRAHWREVSKQRRLTLIAGCRVELTRLKTRSEEWTTVGFESSGQGLQAAADAVFESLDLPGAFDADLSCGYPGWLATL